ncbi:hypothetical protein QR97_06020 [Streptomyces sp. PBH53]|nr:hypothetical protein QR97_06020 [Streptomyces sp. PBH53]
MVAGSAPGEQTGLASSPVEKRAAANAIHDHIGPDTTKAGQAADEQTNAVVKAFDAQDGHGWLTSAAVSKAHKTWGEQVQSLHRRLMSEMSALRGTHTVLTGTDVGVASGVRASSPLDAL